MVQLRRGLPRVPGGEPWPPLIDDTPALRQGLPRVPGGEPWPPVAASAPVAEPVSAGPENTVEVPLRRGLPRIPGGDGWPPAGTVRVAAPPEDAVTAEPAAAAAETPTPDPASAPSAESQPEPVAERGRGVVDKRWLVALALLAVVAVLAARWFIGTDTGADFIARYDGTQPLPDNAPVGFPAWLNWAHFFNMFLMAMIVKTGIDVRREKRPAGYWTSKRGRKISLTQWLHQTLDIAWVVLGVVFYVLLFTTGQWMRIVPTSWETIPNAISAGLQYLALDWPNERSWVAYNALQELFYFITVFIASPLAIVSGFRMSTMWPKSWTGVSIAWARAVHFPTMIYFLVFIAIHVFLVLTTGVRSNMNGMFTARESSDWIGVLVFLLALAVTALGWFVARGSFAAPLAKLTGKVSKR